MKTLKTLSGLPDLTNLINIVLGEHTEALKMLGTREEMFIQMFRLDFVDITITPMSGVKDIKNGNDIWLCTNVFCGSPDSITDLQIVIITEVFWCVSHYDIEKTHRFHRRLNLTPITPKSPKTVPYEMVLKARTL